MCAASPKPARPKPLHTATVVANPAMPAFINLGFSTAASRLLRILVNREIPFMVGSFEDELRSGVARGTKTGRN